MKPFLISITAAVTVLIFLISGCLGSSATTGDTWLIIIGADTVTVSEIGEAWNGLNRDQQEYFTRDADPAGQYIIAFTRKLILQREVESAGYLSDHDIIFRGDSWLRFITVDRSHDYFVSTAEASVTASDLQFYRAHIGKSVWYTRDPGTDSSFSLGPDHLPELSFELALHLDSLSIGQTGTSESGIVARLDSVVVTDPALVAASLSDTVSSNRMATGRIAQGRNRRWQNGIRDDLVVRYSISVDSAAVNRLVDFFSGDGELMDEIVIESDLGDWTAAMLRDEISFMQTRMFVQPTSLTWQFHFIENLSFGLFLADTLQQAAPLLLDSLRAGAEVYMFDLASEKLYNDMVISTINVSEADIEQEYLNLEEPLMVEEMRSIQAVIVPEESLDDYRAAFNSGNIEDYISTLDGFEYIAADPAHPQFTKPLRKNEIPGGFGNEIFDIEQSDTTSWFGPYPVSEYIGYALFRLIDIEPEREALLHEARTYLELVIRTRLEEEATIELMDQLDLKYEPLVNEEAVNDLPVDPGLWASL